MSLLQLRLTDLLWHLDFSKVIIRLCQVDRWMLLLKLGQSIGWRRLLWVAILNRVKRHEWLHINVIVTGQDNLGRQTKLLFLSRYLVPCHIHRALKMQVFRSVWLQSRLCHVSLRATDHQDSTPELVLQITLLLVHREDTLQSISRTKECITLLIFQFTHI